MQQDITTNLLRRLNRFPDKRYYVPFSCLTTLCCYAIVTQCLGIVLVTRLRDLIYSPSALTQDPQLWGDILSYALAVPLSTQAVNIAIMY